MVARIYAIDERLQMAPARSRLHHGVLVFEEQPYDVPRGSSISAWVTRPYELRDVGVTDHAVPIPVSTPQGYKFETAPLPAAFTVQGLSFRTRNRTLAVLNSVPFGPFATEQHEPTWVDFSPAQVGSLVRSGRGSHHFRMDTLSGSPTEAETEKRLLRMRFTGHAVSVDFTVLLAAAASAGAIYFDAADATRRFRVLTTKATGVGTSLVVEQIGGLSLPAVGAGTLTKESGTGDVSIAWTISALGDVTLATVAAVTSLTGTAWANGHTQLAPGSILVTLPSTGVLRDDGSGRLVGAAGDGTVDYLTGAYDLTFAASETGDVVVRYEHSCGYFPIDVRLEWNSSLV